MYLVLDMATLRALRKLANLTQKELAEKIGVSKQHVSSWERGQFNPSPSSVRMLCRALSCKHEELEFNLPNAIDAETVINLLEKNGNEADARIDELEQQVETGSSLLTNMVTLMQESEERIYSQQQRIHALETILKQHGLGDFIP